MTSSSTPAAAPKTVGIIGGMGRMGRMFRPLFEARGHTVLVTGEGSALSNEELVDRAEVVIVSVPVKETPSVLAQVAPLLRPDQLLSDFTSIKQEPVRAMLESRAAVIGCHPIFGPLPTPEGQNVVLCPARPGGYLPWYRAFFEGHGIRVEELTPEQHDRSMAFIQGLTHFINIAFARTLRSEGAELDNLLRVCSPVYRVFFAMLCRILGGDPALYGQIQITNRENIPVVRHFLENGAELLEMAERSDWAAIDRFIAESADYLGDFRGEARRESDFLIEQMKRFIRAGDAGPAARSD